MGDTPCQPAWFRVRKDGLVFPPSSFHGRPGLAPLKPEGGRLASTFKPRLRLQLGLPLVLETVPLFGGPLPRCENDT